MGAIGGLRLHSAFSTFGSGGFRTSITIPEPSIDGDFVEGPAVGGSGGEEAGGAGAAGSGDGMVETGVRRRWRG
ncbi:MAG: hypothetical protein R3F11_25300 [Verrucomicrobiales bacterium]